VAAVIGVHHLQRAQVGAEQLHSHHQVRRGLCDLDDLDGRAAAPRDLVTRRGAP
jgi:hypothetical protein